MNLKKVFTNFGRTHKPFLLTQKNYPQLKKEFLTVCELLAIEDEQCLRILRIMTIQLKAVF
jgi:hypothetical protein